MDSRRQKRERKLKERAQARQEYLANKQELAKYPDFVFEREDEANVAFVQRVKEILAEFDFRKLPEKLRSWYAEAKSDSTFLKRFLIYGNKNPKALAYWFHLGEHIYQSLGKNHWLPFNDCRVVPMGKTILIQFASMFTDRTAGGIVYYSSLNPKIKFNGQEYTVGFSTHAAEQTLNRLVARPESYAGAGDAFSFFSRCVHFEPVKLLDGTPAFSFFDQCEPGFLNWFYVDAVLGKIEQGVNYYRRIGYCPVVLEDGFAKAKTFLPPGYRLTPESMYLNNLSKEKRQEYIEIINTPIRSYLQSNDVMQFPKNYFDPTRHFHKYIPQIIASDREFYKNWSDLS